jgi:FkbM family methyltransferase
MQLRNVYEYLGLRKKSQHYRYEIHSFSLENNIKIDYAQWLHPAETNKIINNEMVNAYREILNNGDFCIDIGAHTGDSTIPMALAVGKSGSVLALEPNPYVYHVLEKNARTNRSVLNIRPLMAAVSGEEGFLEFEYSDPGYCNGGRHEGIPFWKHGHAYKLEVFCINLENELQADYWDDLEHLKFIKVDTEGYDLYVLRSLINTLKCYRPIVKTEIFKKTDKQYRQDMLSLFTDFNYKVYKIIEDPIKPGPRVTVKNVNEWKHYDILCFPEKS